MSNKSSKTQFLLRIPIRVLLTRILRVFPNGRLDPPPRATYELSSGKTLSRLQNNLKILPPPFLGEVNISLGIFLGSAVCSDSGAVFYSSWFSD